MSRSRARESRPNRDSTKTLNDQISERIRALIGDSDIRSFAAKVGISKTWIYDILGGKPASLAILSAIADNTGVNWRWLVTGEGMPSVQWEQTTALVPRVAVSPSTGDTRHLQPTGYYALFATQLLEDLGVALSDAAVFTVPDSDMAPVINVSDEALIHLTEQRLSQGNLFLIGAGGHVTIRRAFSPNGGISWTLSAERQTAPQISISGDSHYQIFGRVRWIGHKL